MPLPKAPNRMGQMLDIAEASTQKAQPPAKARTRARSADKAVKTAAADKAVHAEAATEARVLTDTGRAGQRKPMAAVLTSASAEAASRSEGQASAAPVVAAGNGAALSQVGQSGQVGQVTQPAQVNPLAQVPATTRRDGAAASSPVPEARRPDGNGTQRQGKAPVTVLRTSARKQAEKRRASEV